ncbi:hypothetical protein BH10BAC4_BH10BAC4_06150 [soil metagenome]
MSQVDISIVIPVWNGAPWLEKTLSSIFRQTLIDRSEVIIIDSGSTDQTLEILAGFPVRIHAVKATDFNHGATRNLGVQLSQGQFVVMTVQDAEPVNEFWLSNLMEGFTSDRVAGVCGLQIVPSDRDKNPIEWFRPISSPGIREYSFEKKEDFDRLSPQEKAQICSWDDVTAMYRREALLKIPFRPVSFSEDAFWAKDALEHGLAIVYNGKAQVKHYHAENEDYAFRRGFTILYHQYVMFGLTPDRMKGELISILKNSKTLLREKTIGWNEKYRWLVYNYHQRRGARKAIQLFHEVLKKGADELHKVHFEISGIAPTALNPNTNHA